MVNKHQFQMLAKAFRAGKISLAEFTEQAFNPPAEEQAASRSADAKSSSSSQRRDTGDSQ